MAKSPIILEGAESCSLLLTRAAFRSDSMLFSSRMSHLDLLPFAPDTSHLGFTSLSKVVGQPIFTSFIHGIMWLSLLLPFLDYYMLRSATTLKNLSRLDATTFSSGAQCMRPIPVALDLFHSSPLLFLKRYSCPDVVLSVSSSPCSNASSATLDFFLLKVSLSMRCPSQSRPTPLTVDYIPVGSSLLLRPLVHLDTILLVLGVTCFGVSLPVSDNSHANVASSLKSLIRLGSPLTITDSLQLGFAIVPKSTALLDSALAVLDAVSTNFTFSSKTVPRAENLPPVLGLLCSNPLMFVLSTVHSDSAISPRGFSCPGPVVLAFDFVHVEILTASKGYTCMSFCPLASGMSRLGSPSTVLDFTVMRSVLLFRSYTHPSALLSALDPLHSKLNLLLRRLLRLRLCSPTPDLASFRSTSFLQTCSYSGSLFIFLSLACSGILLSMPEGFSMGTLLSMRSSCCMASLIPLSSIACIEVPALVPDFLMLDSLPTFRGSTHLKSAPVVIDFLGLESSLLLHSMI